MTSVLGSTHVVEQLSFSMFPSNLAFDFDLMLGSFFTVWTIMAYFWNWEPAKFGWVVDFLLCFCLKIDCNFTFHEIR